MKTYVVTSLGLPKANVFTGKSDNVTLCVHDTGTSRASAYINTNVVIHVRTDLVVWVDRHLT